MNYLYNGLELPGLPDSNLPYAAILNGHLIGQGDYSLYFSPAPFAAYTNLLGISIAEDAGTVTLQRYVLNDSEQAWEFKEERELTYPSYLSFLELWSNHDIYSDDGTLKLAASEPVPVSTVQRKPAAILLGFQVGQAIRRMRGKKEPVAFLYGTHGEPLPDIYSIYTPELQAQYPFGYMFIDAYGMTCFRAVNVCPYFNGESMTIPPYDSIDTCILDSGEWRTNFTNYSPTNGSYSHILPFWTNFDLKSEEGTVYMRASDPVPVYE